MRTLIKQTFKYEEEILKSGAIVAANVTISGGKVIAINNGAITIGENSFTFSVYTHGVNDKLMLNLSAVTADINGPAYVDEFIKAVEQNA